MMIFHRPIFFLSFFRLVPSVFTALLDRSGLFGNIFNTAPNCEYYTCEYQESGTVDNKQETICTRKEGQLVTVYLTRSHLNTQLPMLGACGSECVRGRDTTC